MAPACGPFTLLCVISVFFFVVSLTFAGDGDARANVDGSLVRRMRRSVGDSRGLSRNYGVAGARAGNRGGSHGGGRREGRRSGRREGRQRGRPNRRGRQRQSPFSRRERKLVGRLAEASGQFSLQLYSRLKEGRPDLVFSPHSLHTALTMTYMGARARTAQQMLRVLGLRRLRNRAHLAYAALVDSLTNAGNVTLNVANAVYVKPNLPVEDAFRTGLQTMYKAEFDHFDMQAEGGAEAPINRWVAEKTVNKIPNLLSAGTINDLTAMIIINAIYFKGAWRDPFDSRFTSDDTFYRDDGSTTTVPLMTRTASYNYTAANDLSAHIVELPYQGNRFSMYIIVPMTRNMLSDIEERLTLASLNTHVDSMQARHVQLYLPKFTTTSSLALKEPLKRMGMRVPFSRSASFNGICSTHDLKITEVIHQAVIEVTEEGTEAAGASAVIIGLRSFPMQTTLVRADHPFMYGIRDNLSNTWLFMGKYSAQE